MEIGKEIVLKYKADDGKNYDLHLKLEERRIGANLIDMAKEINKEKEEEEEKGRTRRTLRNTPPPKMKQ